ncbi:hypothetical protein KRP22_004617 [Phytophthora ramorum]|uniref:RxLR effector protein PSR2 n=1 Tax=Phytophthora ramorum TaxID=164328 RepID=UPI0030A7836A|nr:RxLR effector protein PSR2 [Phytophthora ramorum]KAH7499629.1 RxLR effector protein PSR2 [Phytophthora ramorum]
MRLTRIALVAAVGLLTQVDSDPATINSKPAASDLSSIDRSPLAATDVPNNRRLRTDTKVDNDEERGINFDKAKTWIMPEVSKQKLERWLTKEKPVENVFTRLRLRQAGDKLLGDPQFAVCVKYVDDLSSRNPKKTTLTIHVLLTHYSDEALVKMVADVKTIPETNTFAIRLQNELAEYWLTKGKTPGGIFTLLQLDKAGDDILTSQTFSIWKTFLNTFNKANSGKTVSMFGTLTNQYGEIGVSRIVEAALKVKSSNYVAKTVQAEQFQRWIRRGESPNAVFELLKLDEAGDNLLASPLLDTFTKYMSTFNMQHGEQQETLIAVLTKYYDVPSLLAAAKIVPSTSRLANKLEAQQYLHWLKTGYDPETAFILLGLGDAGEKLLTKSNFATWLKYTDAFHADNPDTTLKTLSILHSYAKGAGRLPLSDAALARMTAIAEKNPTTINVAKRMKAVLFQGWMRKRGHKTTDDVFTMLKLDEAGERLFQSPMLELWMKYVDGFNKAFPKEREGMKILTTSYDDAVLVKMIELAKKDSSTKEVATKVQSEMLTQFANAQKNPAYVGKLLNIKDKTDANWGIWKKYLQGYQNLHSPAMT